MIHWVHTLMFGNYPIINNRITTSESERPFSYGRPLAYAVKPNLQTLLVADYNKVKQSKTHSKA